MQEDLGSYNEGQLRAVEWQTIKGFIMKAIVDNRVEMPMADALDRRCKTLACFLAHGGTYNSRQLTKETNADLANDDDM